MLCVWRLVVSQQRVQGRTSQAATGQALATLQAHLLALQLEATRAAVAFEVQAVASQRQVTACHIQAPDHPQLAVAALAVGVQAACKSSRVMVKGVIT